MSNGDRFIRQDVWSLRRDDPWDPVTLAYARGVRVMQARPLSDPTSWAYQAAIHATFAAPPPGARWNRCQHQSWYFLPWHRMYLYYFERILREAVIDTGGPSDFALPYWNYDRPFPNNTLPLPFRERTLPDGSRNPLFLPAPRRNAAIARGAQLSPFVTSSRAAMAMQSFTGPPGPGFGGGRRAPAHFGGSVGGLEQTPHNDIHVQVGGSQAGRCDGGLLADPRCAALDPLFWLHHANVDRLWSRWLALGGRRVNPPDAAWRNQAFTFHDETGDPVTVTVAQITDTAAQLHYLYDDDPAMDLDLTPSLGAAAPPPGPAEPSGAQPSGAQPSGAQPSGMPPELAAASEQTVELVGRSVSVRLTPAPDTASLSAAPGPAGARSLYLNVEDIEADRNQGVVYGVFVNLPDDAAGDDDPQLHHVGNISLFGIESMNDPDGEHDGVPGFRHTYDVTDVVGALAADGRWDPADVTVTFQPLAPLPAPDEAGLSGADEATSSGPGVPQESVEAAPIRIGRVSLFLA
jgi:hypothetical protein